jgi:hypothetical protein
MQLPAAVHGGVPPVTHTHALFAEQSQSIPNNLVALFGPQPSMELLGGLAEFERDLIRACTGEGRARAVA